MVGRILEKQLKKPVKAGFFYTKLNARRHTKTNIIN